MANDIDSDVDHDPDDELTPAERREIERARRRRDRAGGEGARAAEASRVQATGRVAGSAGAAGRGRRRWPLIVLAIVIAAAIAIVSWLVIAQHAAPHSSERDDVRDRLPTPGTEWGGGAEATPSDPFVSESGEYNARTPIAKYKDGDPLAKGSLDAPVSIVVFSDYQCRYCAALDVQLRSLEARYVDTGLVRIEWRDLPVVDEESIEAAIAVRAAGAQGRYWPMHDAVYAAAPANADAHLTPEALRAHAIEAGVANMAAWEAALADPTLRKDVETDAQVASILGIRSTPHLIVGNEHLPGMHWAEEIAAVIESELAKTRQSPTATPAP